MLRDKQLFKISEIEIARVNCIYFSHKIGIDNSCRLSSKETICMKCQSLFYVENKKKIIHLSSVELVESIVSVNISM